MLHGYFAHICGPEGVFAFTKPNLPTVLHVAMSVGPTGRGSGRRLGRSGKVGLSPCRVSRPLLSRRSAQTSALRAHWTKHVGIARRPVACTRAREREHSAVNAVLCPLRI